MPATSPLVRLFVSSTFLDFEEERNALHTRVFPHIRATCAARGIHFQPIDLRWGISDEAAASQLALPLCLEEIARCQRTGSRPSFLALIGDRYGWRPPPAAIEGNEFDRVADSIDDPGAAALVRSWYRRDENARPVAYRLLPRQGVSRDARQWQEIETVLARTLRISARRAGLDADARLKYEASATEQEIARAVFGPRGDPAAALCVVRRFLDHDATSADSDEDDRLGALVERLARVCGDRMYRYEVRGGVEVARAAYVERFCNDITKALERALDDQTHDGDLDSGAHEREAHARFAAERRSGFVGRSEELATLLQRTTAHSEHPIVLVGPSGSGKSALMARFEAELRAAPAVRVIARYAGATPLCTTEAGLVQSLLTELRPLKDPRSGGTAEAPDALLARVLRSHSAERLVLLIDAFDQLGTDGLETVPELSWLPRPLPSHLSVVCSAVSETTPMEDGGVHLSGLNRTDAGMVLDAWLAEAGRALQPSQRAAVLSARDSGLPLYLRLAADASRSWRSDDEPEDLPADLPALVRQRLGRLVAPDMHGQAFVARALGYLACSRSGLTEDDLLDLLSGDPDVHSEIKRTMHHALPDGRVPVVLWARLQQDLLATLAYRIVDGDSVLTFYHRQIETSVRERFVTEDVERGLHARLAGHFAQQSSARALAERPWQHALSEDWTAYGETMTDVGYLSARVRAHGPTPLVQDFRLSSTANAPPEMHTALDPIRRALELSAHAIEDDPDQLRTHLLVRLPESAEGPVARVRKELAIGSTGPWIAPLRVSLASIGSPLIRSMVRESHSLTTLASDSRGDRVVAGDQDGMLEVWDVRSGALRRTFGEPGSGVGWLRAGPELRSAAAGHFDRRACLWDVKAAVKVDELTSATLLAVSPDQRCMALTSREGDVVFWDLVSASVVGRRHERGSPVEVGCFTRDGTMCALANRQGEIQIVPIGGELQSIRSVKVDAKISAMFPGAGNQEIVVVVTSQYRPEKSFIYRTDHAILVMDIGTGRIQHRGPVAMAGVWCAPDGKIAVGRAIADPAGHELSAFDLQTGECRWTRSDGHTETEVLAWSPSGEHALTCEVNLEQYHFFSEVPYRIIWIDLATGKCTGLPVVEVKANYRFLHLLAGTSQALGTWCIVEDTVRFSTPAGPSFPPISTPGTQIVGVVPLEGGRAGTASADGIIRVWDVTAGHGEEARAPSSVRAVARSSAREVVVVRSDAIQRIEIESWNVQSNWPNAGTGLPQSLAEAAISTNGAWVLCLSRDTIGISSPEVYMWPTEEMSLWNVATASCAATFSTKLAGGPQLECSHLAVSNDGRRAVFAVDRRDKGGAAAVMWTPDSHERADLVERSARITALALTADGRRVATAWSDGELIVSAVDATRECDSLSAQAPARALAWSPDGKYLAWSCDDGMLSMIRMGADAVQFRGDADRIVFSPDGSALLAIGAKLVWHRVPEGRAVASLTLDAPFVDATILGDGLLVAADRRGDLHLLELREGRARESRSAG